MTPDTDVHPSSGGSDRAAVRRRRARRIAEVVAPAGLVWGLRDVAANVVLVRHLERIE